MNLASHAVRATVVAIGLLIGSFAATGTAVADDLGGTWTKRSQSIKGSWHIETTAEGRFLVLDDEFRTRRAPDLKLFLSPLAADDVNARNATEGSTLIAKLEKAKGGQRYRIPDDIDLAAFQTLVLHCEKYTKLWGVSAL